MVEIGDDCFVMISTYGHEQDKVFRPRSGSSWEPLEVREESGLRMERSRTGNGRFGADDRPQVLIAGGCVSRSSVDNVETYDPREGLWKSHSTLNIARECPGVASVGGKTYVVGGKGAGGSVEVWDEGEGIWKVLEDGVKYKSQEYLVSVLNRS